MSLRLDRGYGAADVVTLGLLLLLAMVVIKVAIIRRDSRRGWHGRRRGTASMTVLLGARSCRCRGRLRLSERNCCLIVANRVGGIIIIVRRRGAGGSSGI